MFPQAFLWRHTLLLTLWALVCCSGCSSAPILLDAGRDGPSVLDDIPTAARYSFTTDDGTKIVGVLTDAPGQRLVVLHLLPTGASPATGISVGIGRASLAGTVGSLADLGFTSLIFDYRGVGMSGGKRTSRHLIADGRAMWEHAVRLAGGREDRVVLRAGSVGTLVVASLLDRGASPAGVVLYAPVRAGTLIRHAAREHGGPIAALLAPAVYSLPESPDLDAVLPATSVPILVILPSEDVYLPRQEMELVRRGAEAGGHAILDFPGDHQQLVLRQWGFTLDRASYSGRRTPDLLPEERAFLLALPRPEAASDPDLGLDR